MEDYQIDGKFAKRFINYIDLKRPDVNIENTKSIQQVAIKNFGLTPEQADKIKLVIGNNRYADYATLWFRGQSVGKAVELYKHGTHNFDAIDKMTGVKESKMNLDKSKLKKAGKFLETLIRQKITDEHVKELANILGIDSIGLEIKRENAGDWSNIVAYKDGEKIVRNFDEDKFKSLFRDDKHLKEQKLRKAIKKEITEMLKVDGHEYEQIKTDTGDRINIGPDGALGDNGVLIPWYMLMRYYQRYSGYKVSDKPTRKK